MMGVFKRFIGIIVLVNGLTACKLISDESVVVQSSNDASTSPSVPVDDFSITSGDDSNPVPKNEGPVILPPPVVSADDQELNEEGFLINKGAAYTQSLSVELTLLSLAPNKMAISMGTNCQSTTWITYTDKLVVQLPNENQSNTVSVQFQDWEGGISNCFRRSIIHDNKGPEILVQTYPVSILAPGSNAEIAFMIRDDRPELVQSKCTLNSISKSCLYGMNKVSLSNLAEGSYTFSIEALDHLGNKSQASVTWSVLSSYKLVTQSFKVDNYKKVDVLFVIDNSGSMEYEQSSMAQRTSNFLSVLKGLDYQIAITTTDPKSKTYGDGHLVTMTGAPQIKILDSSMEFNSAQQLLSSTLHRDEEGSGDEQGIRAVYRAIERYNSGESTFRSFFRNDAQFSVVLISDEDESDNTDKNDPEKLLSLINSTWNGQKRFNFNSIITRPDDCACRSTYGAAYGERYKMLSDLTGGIVGDVCASDYAQQAAGVADQIRGLLKTLTLSCAPTSANEIAIKKDGVSLSLKFKIEGLNLKFDKELDPGSYQVSYKCLKSQ